MSARIVVISPWIGEPHGPSPALDAARAAAHLAAKVEVLALVAPEHAAEMRQHIGKSGFAASLVEAKQAVDGGVPSVPDVDRLLDRLGRALETPCAFVVCAADLAAKKPDFVERAIGRARGLGGRVIAAEAGASLKQAFHAQPFGAVVPEAELAAICPPDAGKSDADAEETLRRIFEDPVRVLLVERPDGALLVATRSDRVDLGARPVVSPAALAGFLAAALATAGDDYAAAARAAIAAARQ